MNVPGKPEVAATIDGDSSASTPSAPSIASFTCSVILGLMGVALAVSLIWGKYWLAGRFIDAASQQAVDWMKSPSFPEAQWQKRMAAEISFSSPLPLTRSDDLSEQFTKKLRSEVKSIDIYNSGIASKSFQTLVSRREYLNSVAPTIEREVGSIYSGTQEMLDGEQPTVQLAKSVQISGLEAFRTQFTGKLKKAILHIDMVVIKRGQIVWTVQIVHFGDISSAYSARILDSIEIER